MDRTGGIVFDMEGVLHIGYRPLPGSETALAALDAAGIPHVILTNTTSKTRTAIAARLAEHGVYSIGRYGGWDYTSMEDSIVDGITSARRAIA